MGKMIEGSSRRKEVHSTADTTRMDNSLDARRFPGLRCISATYLPVDCQASAPLPSKPGNGLAVYLPRNGNGGGWDATGRVVRCEPSVMGFRVALEFDPLMAA